MSFEDRLDRLDRRHYRGGLWRGTRLDLEMVDQTPKYLVLRMVRRGWKVTGEEIGCLADFYFVLPRTPLLAAYNDRFAEPQICEQILSARLLQRLTVQSERIMVPVPGFVHEFGGLTKNGRLIQCETKGESDELTPVTATAILHDN